jgi:sulfoxide reductase heme-binding subunit YedZ
VWALCLLPVPLALGRLFLGDGFGANPIEEIEHFTGDVALISLLAVLSITPLRRLSGWNDLQKVRRLVGLFAFFWVSVHFMAWIGLDQFFAWEFIGEDIAERPFVLVGFTAFLLLLPLAVTSTKGWIRRLGKNWTRLHRLVYLATVLGVVHFFWVTKADDRWPMLALGCWAVLMTLRLALARRRARPAGPAARAAEVSEAA